MCKILQNDAQFHLPKSILQEHFVMNCFTLCSTHLPSTIWSLDVQAKWFFHEKNFYCWNCTIINGHFCNWLFEMLAFCIVAKLTLQWAYRQWQHCQTKSMPNWQKQACQKVALNITFWNVCKHSAYCGMLKLHFEMPKIMQKETNQNFKNGQQYFGSILI